MVQIVTGNLTGNSLYQSISDFICSQGTYEEGVVNYFASQRGCFAAILDGDAVVGTSLTFDVDGARVIAEKISSFLLSSGIDIATCVSPACIYLDDAYTGQGLGDQMTVARSQYCIDQGYEYTVLWEYDTQAIFDYSTRVGNLIDTGMVDSKNFPIYLRRLSDVVSALT